MIFSSRYAPLRYASAVPPLMLLSGIVFVWYRFHVGFVYPLFISGSGTDFALPLSGWTAVAASVLTTNSSCIVLMLSFWRAVATPAGPVPSWYVRKHRAATAWFQTRQTRFTELDINRANRDSEGHVAADSARRERRVRWADSDDGLPASSPAEDEGSTAPRDLRIRAGGAAGVRESAPTPMSSAPSPSMSATIGGTASRLSAALTANPPPASSVAELASILQAQAAARSGGTGAAHEESSARRSVPAPPPPELRGAIGRDGGYRPGPHDMRWCKHCSRLKPPRSHHCSVCGSCVLKMDHHCPWVGNCVGFNNYKAFFLLLAWGFVALSCAYAVWLPVVVGWWSPLVLRVAGSPPAVGGGGGTGTSASVESQPEARWQPASEAEAFRLGGSASASSSQGPTGPPLALDSMAAALLKVNAGFLFSSQSTYQLVGFVAGCSLTASLFLFLCMHLFLVLRGSTTLEAGDDGPRLYDYGPLRNWQLVFGRDPRWWFWPAVTNDVLVATAGGTLFKGYIGDAAFLARQMHQHQLLRSRLSRGSVDANSDDEQGAENAAEFPSGQQASAETAVEETALLLGQ